ncbi:MAG TPA: DNA polymerase II large subunit [Candidatus Diapherotrites archaeon]|nr:DNA polymerase II large subunit [Candidatus Diapherotrites archaeon]
MNDINLIATPDVKKYYNHITEKVDHAIDIAKQAKQTGKDVSTEIETLPAPGIAEKTEILTGPSGVAKIYNKLWEKYQNRTKVILEIFNMIIDKKLGNIEDPEKRLEQAIRTALVIETEGVVVSPLDGLPKIKISKNFDGSEYVDIYYASPIRAAGANAQTLPLLLADLAREKLHIDKYKPNKEEIERIIEEVMIYQTEVVVRQERITEKEIRTIAENCPICVNAEPDTNAEVMAHRDLERIPSNKVRGAMCLVLIDGLFVRAMKIMNTAKEFGLNWNWLEQLIKIKKTTEGLFELKPSYKYLEGLAAGRPVFGYPLIPGGFRLRYGKARNTGLMAKGINPATMYILDEFIAVGTHGKIERPGKALQFFPCTTIDGPIVKLKNQEVIKIDDAETAKKYIKEIDKILFVGDILCTIGDIRKSGDPLIKNGYVEEEWLAEIKYLYKNEKINKQTYEKALKFYENPAPHTAIEIAIEEHLPLFPKYIWYYDLLNTEELKTLIKQTRNAQKIFSGNKIVNAKIEYQKETKEILEKIGIPHKYDPQQNIISLENEQAYPFLKTIGALNAINPLDEHIETFQKDISTTQKLSEISKIDIREKSGTYIGARMGRPEAAHERLIKGNPNVLFPIGQGYGNSRDIVKASMKKSNNAKGGEYGISEIECKAYLCTKCKKITYHNYCFECNQKTLPIRYCPKCKKEQINEICPICNQKTIYKTQNKINLKKALENACNNLNITPPEKINGVKGLINQNKIAEPLEKGILRAKYGLHVFRDGTIRFEALNATITQISAKELGIDVKKLKELGYTQDYLGNELKNENQKVSIFPQDIILNEKAEEYFIKISKFIDDLLEKFYGLPKYYNINTKEDLIGELVIGIAPHTSAGVIGRIIGFSKSKLCWGHPYFITAKRRNIDGDQDSLLLLMDGLLNFSQKYLSEKRGGRMDTPLSFTTIINPYEVDSESRLMETITEYPYEIYLAAKNFGDPKTKEITYVEDWFGKEEQYSCIKFTHDTELFDEGPKESTYIQIKSMEEKVKKQAELQEKIVAVDNKDALERLLHYHLFPDVIGNTRAFSRQKLRCVKCNKKYRRMPLSGTCDCGGKLILTIAEGSIKKYVEISKEIIKKYELKPFLLQRITLAEEEINSLFCNKEEKQQKSLSEFF